VGWLALVLALLLGACAPKALPPAAGPSPIALETLRRTQAMFLYPDRLNQDFLVGALDALELRFDSVRFEELEGEAQGLLSVGNEAAVVPLEEAFNGRRYLEILSQALHFVDAYLQDEREEEDDLELIALNGGLGALDPYSTIFSGRTTEDFRIRFSGKLSGIGSRIGRRDGHLTAVEVFPDSPAERGGLKDGDWIVAIDGDPTQPLSVTEAVDRIRGEAGTPIVLSLRRGEEEEKVEVQITRGEVSVPNVSTKSFDDGTGYARIFSVSRTTATEFQEKVTTLGDIDGLVLDLRGNTGGSMLAAQQLADLFLSRQLIVRVVGREGRAMGPRSREIASPRVAFDMPVVILVDGSTASAAEILSGAMAPLEKVTIVGEKTFGKGVIQQVLPLPNENLLKLTVAEYRLSNDRVVHEKGIEPDIVLAPVPGSRLGRLGSAEAGAIAYVRTPGEDDDFPEEVARILLTRPRENALAEIRKRASAGIAEALADFEIEWASLADLPQALPVPLQVRIEHGLLVAGARAPLELVVDNPNPFEIHGAWAALDAPAEYLSNKFVALGTLPAGGAARGRVDIEPPDGVSVVEHPLTVRVGAGDRQLHSQEISLLIEPRTPQLQIEVVRTGDEQIQVVIQNRGEHPTGPITISVPGANRSLENIDAGGREEIDLTLSAQPDEVAVVLSGPWVRRRIAVPIPDERLLVVPPELRVTRERARFGGPEVRIDASGDVGLGQAWIQLDGQKLAYADWHGRTSGSLSAPILPRELENEDDDGGHDLAVKIETIEDVSILDLRRLPAQQSASSAAAERTQPSAGP
jgi:carboxyl-terminal processing protease